ncbi:MAG: ABC transporter ATP-binding protein [Gaiellaceae bacterium]
MAVESLYREPDRASDELEWPALEFNDVFKLFRSGPVETVALRGLDLRIERREIVALLGPSGSGKSTFLQLAAGMDQPSAGEVRAFGQSLGRLDDRDLARYRGAQIAVVLQSDNLWSSLTALDNVAASLALAGRDGGRGRARAALGEFGLEHRCGHYPSQLSGGEQQRVAIAAAAARRAALVLADEPSGELDATNEQLVIDALATLRDDYGSTVVTVTHSRGIAESADRVIELRDGRAL